MNPLLSNLTLTLAQIGGQDATAPDASTLNAWTALMALPGAPAVVAMASVGLGVLLWLAGAKIVKPVGALVGAILGVILGSGLIAGILSARLDLPGTSVLAFLLAGLGGAAIGLVAYRLVCAGLAGVSVAALVLLATICTISPSPQHAGTTPRIQLASLLSLPTRDSSPDSEAAIGESVQAVTDSALSTADLRRLVPESGLARWDSLAPVQRNGATLAAIVAGLLAAFAGLVAPARASAFSASILGSGLALAGIAWLTQRSAIDAGLSPAPWLIAWGLLAVLGLAVQTGSVKPEPKPA